MSVTIEQAAKQLAAIFAHNKQVHAEHLAGDFSNYPLTPMLWGPPGVGKSSIVKKAVSELEWNGQPYDLKDIRLSTLSPLDVRGLPRVAPGSDRAEWVAPAYVPRATDAPCVIFYDEVNTAPASNQVTAYETALDRKVGGHQLPVGTEVVMGGNRTEDRGATHEMPAPLANRMIHIEIEAHLDSFINFAVDKGVDASIIGFLKFKPDMLLKMPKGKERAFPTPRTWHMLSGFLKFDDSFPAVAGLIGEGPATEFRAFRELSTQLPNLDDILSGKAKPFTHDKNNVMYAYTSGLAVRYLNIVREEDYKGKKAQAATHNFLGALMHVSEEFAGMGIFMVGRNEAMKLLFNDSHFKNFASMLRAVMQ